MGPGFLKRLLLCVPLLLAACAEHVVSDPELVAARRYTSQERPYVELVTTVKRDTEKGAHVGLIINGSERVIWDPAGTFQHEDLAEVEDVHHGATDRLVSYYKRYHARFSHYVQSQRVYLDPASAERLLISARNHGAVPKMFCSTATADVLRVLPQFANVSRSMFPERLRASFARIPGVEDSYIEEQDTGQNVPTN